MLFIHMQILVHLFSLLSYMIPKDLLNSNIYKYNYPYQFESVDQQSDPGNRATAEIDTLSLISYLLLSIRQVNRLQKQNHKGSMCYRSCITTTERLITPFIDHYHSTFKIQINGNNYKYKTCLQFKFYSSHKSQLSRIIFLLTEKRELMATFPDEHIFLLPQSFSVKHHFIISSYCLLHGN